jgi:hypothetical protein
MKKDGGSWSGKENQSTWSATTAERWDLIGASTAPTLLESLAAPARKKRSLLHAPTGDFRETAGRNAAKEWGLSWTAVMPAGVQSIGPPG